MAIGWPLELLDWKRRVFAMCAAVRDGGPGEATVTALCRSTDELFGGLLFPFVSMWRPYESSLG